MERKHWLKTQIPPKNPTRLLLSGWSRSNVNQSSQSQIRISNFGRSNVAWSRYLSLAAIGIGTFLFAFLRTTSPGGFIAVGGLAYLTLWTITLQTVWILFSVLSAGVLTKEQRPLAFIDSAWLFVASLGVGVTILFWVLLVPNNENLHKTCLHTAECAIRAVLSHGGLTIAIILAPWILQERRKSKIRLRKTILVTEIAITFYLIWYIGLYLTQGHFVYSMRTIARSIVQERFLQLAAILVFLFIFHVAIIFLAKIRRKWKFV